MSYQYPGQYKPKAQTFDDVTEMFRNNFLMQILTAGFAASLCAVLQTTILSWYSDGNASSIRNLLGLTLAFLLLFLVIFEFESTELSKRREVEFLVDRIKSKFDTTGMVFNNRLSYFRKVTGTLASAEGTTDPLDVAFVFHSKTNEPFFVTNSKHPSWYPQRLNSIYQY